MLGEGKGGDPVLFREREEIVRPYGSVKKAVLGVQMQVHEFRMDHNRGKIIIFRGGLVVFSGEKSIHLSHIYLFDYFRVKGKGCLPCLDDKRGPFLFKLYYAAGNKPQTPEFFDS